MDLKGDPCLHFCNTFGVNGVALGSKPALRFKCERVESQDLSTLGNALLGKRVLFAGISI